MGLFSKNIVEQDVKINNLIVSLITPMNEDYTIDEIGYKALIAKLMNKGVRNFLILDNTNDLNKYDLHGEKQLIKFASNNIGKKGNLIIGCFSNSTDEIIEKIKHAEKFSKIVAINIPQSALTNDISFMDFFDKLFTKTKKNIIIINDPKSSGKNIPVEGLNLIANWERLIGVIDYSQDLNYFHTLSQFHQCFNIYQGYEKLATDSYSYYCSGIVSSLANLTPSYFFSLKEDIEFSNNLTIQKKQEAINNLIDSCSINNKKIQSYKYLLYKNGLIQPYYSKELPILTEEEISTLDELIKKILV
ncbi:MAG: dihydrodipicolinate synthase family protein [Candidatus ainarchaeum sp.]|nr:dihydrodipicolinate synthase family protein [Candidatus ainarchaeum sp.]